MSDRKSGSISSNSWWVLANTRSCIMDIRCCLSSFNIRCSESSSHLHVACKKWKMHSRSVACCQCTLRACLRPVSVVKMPGSFWAPLPPKVSLGRMHLNFSRWFSRHSCDWLQLTQTTRGNTPHGWYVCIKKTGLLCRSMLPDESIKTISPGYVVPCTRDLRGVHMDHIRSCLAEPFLSTLCK